MPFSAAQETKRPTMSPLTGREPTRKRPRSAIPSGVDTRALIARIRSHGLSTRRRTVASKTPPPEISRQAKPAPSRISATRRISAVGILPARGSCESNLIVVSTSFGIHPDLSALSEGSYVRDPVSDTDSCQCPSVPNRCRSLHAETPPFSLLAPETCQSARRETCLRSHDLEMQCLTPASYGTRLSIGYDCSKIRLGRCSGLRAGRP